MKLDFLNWKKRPASVFLIAGPLALLAFGLVALRAFLEWHYHGDYWYAVIVLVGVALFCFAMWPIRHALAAALGQQGSKP